MPFGLTNAPSTFQRALDISLARYKCKTCLVYIDDVIVFSKSIKDHIQHVDDVLTLLGNADISLKRNKCEIFHQSIKYLGHVIRPEKLEIDASQTKVCGKHGPPKTLRNCKFSWAPLTYIGDS